METLEINFCKLCADTVKSKALHEIWREICICALNYDCVNWIDVLEEDCLTLKSIEILEKKSLIVSTDFEETLLVKPRGVLVLAKSCFLVCLDPERHFCCELDN